jgi:hypothetical protein
VETDGIDGPGIPTRCNPLITHCFFFGTNASDRAPPLGSIYARPRRVGEEIYLRQHFAHLTGILRTYMFVNLNLVLNSLESVESTDRGLGYSTTRTCARAMRGLAYSHQKHIGFKIYVGQTIPKRSVARYTQHCTLALSFHCQIDENWPVVWST